MLACQVNTNHSVCVKPIDRWVGLARLTAETAGGGPLADFVEGLGPGQLVGRQVLAAPALGDVQLALCDRKGRLEVEVIRARGLQARTGSKLLPGTKPRTHYLNTLLFLFLQYWINFNNHKRIHP